MEDFFVLSCKCWGIFVKASSGINQAAVLLWRMSWPHSFRSRWCGPPGRYFDLIIIYLATLANQSFFFPRPLFVSGFVDLFLSNGWFGNSSRTKLFHQDTWANHLSFVLMSCILVISISYFLPALSWLFHCHWPATWWWFNHASALINKFWSQKWAIEWGYFGRSMLHHQSSPTSHALWNKSSSNRFSTH